MSFRCHHACDAGELGRAESNAVEGFGVGWRQPPFAAVGEGEGNPVRAHMSNDDGRLRAGHDADVSRHDAVGRVQNPAFEGNSVRLTLEEFRRRHVCIVSLYLCVEKKSRSI